MELVRFCIIIGIALLLFALFTSARMGIYQVYVYIYENLTTSPVAA